MITANGGLGIRFARGRRAKRARIKRGMRRSYARTSQQRLMTFKLISKGMKANELLDHLNQRRGNKEETKKKR